jgi:hypothetical protein
MKRSASEPDESLGRFSIAADIAISPSCSVERPP